MGVELRPCETLLPCTSWSRRTQVTRGGVAAARRLSQHPLLGAQVRSFVDPVRLRCDD